MQADPVFTLDTGDQSFSLQFKFKEYNAITTPLVPFLQKIGYNGNTNTNVVTDTSPLQGYKVDLFWNSDLITFYGS